MATTEETKCERPPSGAKKSGGARTWLRRFFFLVVALLLAPVLAELLIQLTGDPRLREIAALERDFPAQWGLARAHALVLDDRELRYRLKPGFRATIAGNEYRVNEFGLRGAPVTHYKPRSVQRVLVLGDSYVFGLGVAEEKTLSSQLQELLTADGVSTEVLNAGVPGYHTGQEQTLLERTGFAFTPDLVILVYDPDDNVVPASTLAPSIGTTYVDELPIPYAWKPRLSRFYLYSLLAKLDTARREARGEHNWPATVARIQAIAQSCAMHEVEFLLAPLPELTTSLELRDDRSDVVVDYQRMRELARSSTIEMVDLLDGLRQPKLALEPLLLQLQPKDNHFNADGYALLAKLIEPAAKKLLAKRTH